MVRPGKRYGQFAILDYFVDSRKVIWSAREGLIDPATDDGYDKCISAGGRADAEWRELRRRTMDGKEALRREGRNVSGEASLPRGVAFDKSTGKWSYEEPDCLRVLRMMSLLLAGDSGEVIAEKVGSGFTARGVFYFIRCAIPSGSACAYTQRTETARNPSW